jgi:5-methylthioadenosine/S-adenosylhomocysteine deaminase
MTELLIHNAIIVTMDAQRRVLERSSIAIGGGRIVEIGPAAALADKYAGVPRIDATHKIVLPGLVDLHGYLGGSLLKSIGEDMDAATKRDRLETVLSRSTDEEWWQIEAQLAAVERLKLGTTTMFSMMGGNGTRTDDPVFAEIAAAELARIGLRTRIGLSPARPPWPRPYSYYRDGIATERQISFEHVIEVCDQLLAKQARTPPGLVDFCVALSRIGNRNDHDPVWSPEREHWIRRQADAISDLMRRYRVGFFTHMYGNAIDYAHDERLGLLGPQSILSHCTGISERSIAIMQETGAHAAHHPRAARMYSFPGRCPVPELIDAGIAVGLGADTPSNHDCDLFLDMKAAILLQRMHFKDPRMLPPGKALEMATIDGYRALGLDAELGSIEPGKKADLITIDLRQPHLAPTDMPVYRLVYGATGRDVSDAIVDGRLVMQGRKMLTIDEEALLDRVQEVYRRFVERGGLAPLTGMPARFWGVSRT